MSVQLSTPLWGVRETAIEGRFRRITTHQLCLAWWLHTAGHLTRRQLRVYFAAHEMHERRRYTLHETDRNGRQRRREASYGLEELKGLVGGRGSPTADAELAADVRHLARLGLVKIEPRSITFATSSDQIAIDDLSGFWEMFAKVPNQGRSVPVPRRTLRALAGGFSRGVTGVMIALMIRSLFWHRESMDYRIDGRTKGTWIADVFGLSRRAVSDARSHLIELGWLMPIDARQWELNRWGSHDRINADWSLTEQEGQGGREGEGGQQPTSERIEPIAITPDQSVGFASPPPEIPAGFASPCLNSSPSLRENLKTRTLAAPAGSSGVSRETRWGGRKERTESGRAGHPGRTRRKRKGREGGEPILRDIRPEDLRDTGRVLGLFDQAVAKGLISGSEAGRLDFVALAERARAQGNDAPRLFAWLLAKRKFEFITQADEDAAVNRLKVWRDGPRREQGRRDAQPSARVAGARPVMTDDERLVQVCLRMAEQKRVADPYFAAKSVRPEWTRERWENACRAFEAN